MLVYRVRIFPNFAVDASHLLLPLRVLTVPSKSYMSEIYMKKVLSGKIIKECVSNIFRHEALRIARVTM